MSDCKACGGRYEGPFVRCQACQAVHWWDESRLQYESGQWLYPDYVEKGWEVTRRGESEPVGRGPTAATALADLRQKVEERERTAPKTYTCRNVRLEIEGVGSYSGEEMHAALAKEPGERIGTFEPVEDLGSDWVSLRDIAREEYGPPQGVRTPCCDQLLEQHRADLCGPPEEYGPDNLGCFKRDCGVATPPDEHGTAWLTSDRRAAWASHSRIAAGLTTFMQWVGEPRGLTLHERLWRRREKDPLRHMAAKANAALDATGRVCLECDGLGHYPVSGELYAIYRTCAACVGTGVRS